MILPDTSAWIEYLRATGSPVHLYLDELIRSGIPLATTEVVIMEVFAGARDDVHLARLQRFMFRCVLVPLDGLESYESAARLYRDCRRQGETVRQLTDCLVAVCALAANASILHADRDFDILARHSLLRVVHPHG